MEQQAFVRVLIAGLLIVMIVVALLDLIFELKYLPSVAQHLQTWSGKHPLLAVGLVAVLGAMVGHFFLWPIPPDPRDWLGVR